jgi:hypothetical protein
MVREVSGMSIGRWMVLAVAVVLATACRENGGTGAKTETSPAEAPPLDRAAAEALPDSADKRREEAEARLEDLTKHLDAAQADIERLIKAKEESMEALLSAKTDQAKEAAEKKRAEIQVQLDGKMAELEALKKGIPGSRDAPAPK